MKCLKIFIVLCLIIITTWVLVGGGELHKHFVLTDSGFEFNVKNVEQQNEQSAALFKIGEKIKTKNEVKTVRELEEQTYDSNEVTIIPSEILIAKMREQQAQTIDSTTSSEQITSITNSDNSISNSADYMNNMEMLQQVVDMVDKNKLTENDIQKAMADIEAAKRSNSNRTSPSTSVASLNSGSRDYRVEEPESSGCSICDMFRNNNNPYRDETIAWNIWRSNLQNRIMDDSKIDANYGTIFFFSFKVDKYRNITNIRVTCTDKSDTYSVNAVREAIENLNGKRILEFPEGSNRKTVNFTGGFLIGSYAQYSTPNDYNDYEHIRF